VPARRGRGRARFDTISHEWLREPAKRWSRFRLATGCAFPTINAGALALARFSRFLAEHHPEVIDAAGITRPVMEDYLAWLLTCGYSPSTPSAEWVKHNLNRIRDSLPNGYCGRPAQQDCPTRTSA
jgi:hypothetical protein